MLTYNYLFTEVGTFLCYFNFINLTFSQRFFILFRVLIFVLSL